MEPRRYTAERPIILNYECSMKRVLKSQTTNWPSETDLGSKRE